MKAAGPEHPVYRVIEGRARGWVPLLPQEGVVALVVGIAVAGFGQLVVGGLTAGVVLAALRSVRKADHDRADAVFRWLRPSTGWASAAAPDVRHRPLIRKETGR